MKLSIILLFILSYTLPFARCETLNESVGRFIRNITSLVVLSFIVPQDDITVLPVSKDMYHVNSTSNEIYRKGLFLAGMTRSSNCRASLDKWDCPTCKSTLPDGVVVRSFRTHPLDVTGYIVASAKNKAFYITTRGASTGLHNRYNNLPVDLAQIVDHPYVPGAKVFSAHLDSFLDIREIVYDTLVEQIAWHPNYTIEVIGHSSGASIASLLSVDLFQRFPQKRKQIFAYTLGEPRLGNRAYAKYIADNSISIKRYVDGIDAVPHFFQLRDGYEHEGDEYWIKSYNPLDIVVCPGPYETKSCATSTKLFTSEAHLDYFGIYQGCTDEEKLTEVVPIFT